MSDVQAPHFHCRLQAVFWIILWATLFSSAMAIAKMLSHEVNSVTLIFSRSLVGIFAAFPLFLKNGLITPFRTKRLKLHLFRILVVSSSMGCTYYAYRNLPIAYAAAIGQTGPLFTTVMAIFILQEQVKWFKWFALILGYTGVILMLRPTEGLIDFSTCIALLANLLAGVAIISTKKLTDTESSETILFYATFGVLSLSAFLSLWFWNLPNTSDLIKFCGIGIAGVSSQYCYIRALSKAPASFITPFEYSRLCMTIPIGFVLFDEIPDIWTILGSLIIIIAIIFLTRVDKEKD